MSPNIKEYSRRLNFGLRPRLQFSMKPDIQEAGSSRQDPMNSTLSTSRETVSRLDLFPIFTTRNRDASYRQTSHPAHGGLMAAGWYWLDKRAGWCDKRDSGIRQRICHPIQNPGNVSHAQQTQGDFRDRADTFGCSGRMAAGPTPSAASSARRCSRKILKPM